MNRYFTIALLGVTLMGLPVLSGCDKDKDASEVKTTTQNPDGSTTVNKEKSSVDTKTGNGSTTIEQKTTGAPATQP